jgi:hypothetical protein
VSTAIVAAMHAVRRRLQVCTWLALVAMLALALLPTVSHALTHGQGGQSAWAEICTPQGMKVVAVGGVADEGSPVQAATHLEYCPYCAGAATAAGLPPAPPQVPDLSAAAERVPLLFLQAPRTLFAWRSAQPRAPPIAS